ncbi:MAG TPA: hypothetical protein VFQ61_27515 [Polyangiaceae bacterium]|nr:hypothetical protein [Polyangiaceae bacterium]
MNRWMLLPCLLLAVAPACRETQECERARMNLAKTWKGLRESAARKKLAGGDVPSWQYVEQRADLLESAFTTSQVTWPSADKATTELAAKLTGMRVEEGDMSVTAFRSSVQGAFQEQATYAKLCR